MKKQWGIKVCTLLLVVNLVLTALLICGVFPQEKDEGASDICYTLYIGTNDKDTNTQLIPTEEAREIVNEICNRYVTGYTALTGYGGWDAGSGAWVQEESLVYIFMDAEEEQVLKIKDEVLEKLNQGGVLLEKREVGSTFFYR